MSLRIGVLAVDATHAARASYGASSEISKL